MSKEILELLDRNKSANINKTNNYNNTNDTNDILTTSTFAKSNDEEVMALTSSSLGRESLSEEKVVLKLPPEWRGVKFDLFCNGTNKDGSKSLKLNIGVIRSLDGESIPLQASLNSSWDSGVRRGVDATQWRENSHWIKVRQHRKELEYIYEPRASKIGKKTKQGGTNWVAFVYKDRKCVWCIDVVREAKVYSFELTDPLTSAQQQKNMIATAYRGVRKQALIDPRKEWGI